MTETVRPTFASAYRRDANNFDFLRFVLAAMVIWSHCFPLSGRTMDWFYAASGQIDGGSLAVDCFFVLSGFLITQSWLAQPRVSAYARKRALRILPAMVAALAFGALLIGPFVVGIPVGEYLSSRAPWLHFLGVAMHRYLAVPPLFADNPLPFLLNAPLWSLRYELLCYALVPVLVAGGGRLRMLASLVLFAACWLYCLAHPGGETVAAMFARLLGCFVAGAILYMARERVPYSGNLAVVATAVLALTFFTTGFRAVFPVAGSYLLLFVAFSSRLPLHHFARHGDVSYGLYVFAYPIQQAVVWLLGPEMSVAFFFAIAFAAALLVAGLSWRFVEAPALARKKRASVAFSPVVCGDEKALSA
ncbi:MAG TPA: acyltransferase [Candidatus Dormibacteraeota bacterium]|nr:acyltransferase [Candidatus Dormibacteraeota bacterium]